MVQVYTYLIKKYIKLEYHPTVVPWIQLIRALEPQVLEAYNNVNLNYGNIENLHQTQDNPADHYRNLQKLKYFLSYSIAVFLHIQKVGSLHIWFEDKPMYAISIIYKNGTYSVGAHSDIEDYYRWDKIVEQII